VLRHTLLAITKQARDELALPNALNLLFGKGLLTGATLSQSLDRHLLEPFGALDGDALRLVSLFSFMKVGVHLNGMVLEHSICTFYKKVPKGLK
jgi:hypothetical protein